MIESAEELEMECPVATAPSRRNYTGATFSYVADASSHVVVSFSSVVVYLFSSDDDFESGGDKDENYIRLVLNFV